MPSLESVGRVLLMAGAAVVLLGLVLVLLAKVPGVGRLPGDIVLRREGFGCYIPLATSILLSLLLTVLLNVITRIRSR